MPAFANRFCEFSASLKPDTDGMLSCTCDGVAPNTAGVAESWRSAAGNATA
jgi:hypothetical protein